MKKIFFIIPFLSSCVQYTYLGNAQKTYPINFDEVQVFENEKDLPAEYEKVAILSFDNSSKFKYDDAKQKASEIGCNGVILKSYTKATLLEKVIVGETDKSEFIAIRFMVNGQYPKKRTKQKIIGDDLY